MSCGPDHCITCSDEAVPMQVVEFASPGIAICEDESGVASEVMTDLVGQVDLGATVLVHAGTALLLTETRSV